MSTFTSLLVLFLFLLFYTVLGERTPDGIMVLPIHEVENNPAVGSFRRRDNVPVAKVFNGSQYVVSSKSFNSTYENNLTVAVAIGAPPQPVVLEIDVNSSWSWVNPTCANATDKDEEEKEEKEYCDKNPRYDPESSKSSNVHKESEGSGIVSRVTNETMMEGTLVTDTLTLGSNSVKDQLFTLASWSKNMSVGALALGPWGWSESMVKSLPGEAFSLNLHSANKEGKYFPCQLQSLPLF